MARANTKIYETGELERVQVVNNNELAAKEAKRVALASVFKAQTKFAVVGAPMYQAHFGKKMCISINGIPIYVPLDGRQYEIPESYAEVFQSRIRDVNETLERQKVLSNVRANAESYPGELDFIKPV